MQASMRSAGAGLGNLHPIMPGLRDPAVPMPSVAQFLCGAERRRAAPKRIQPAPLRLSHRPTRC